MALLERTSHHTYCPYKGDCSYYNVPAGGQRSDNAAPRFRNRAVLRRRPPATAACAPGDHLPEL